VSDERKAKIDAILLALPGVTAKKIGGVHAYIAGDRMFACLGDKGVGLRLPVARCTELQFSRGNVSSFAPGGVAGTREWIQVQRDNPDDYDKDLELFRESLEFAKRGGR
jgi:hypothetical protein